MNNRHPDPVITPASLDKPMGGKKNYNRPILEDTRGWVRDERPQNGTNFSDAFRYAIAAVLALIVGVGITLHVQRFQAASEADRAVVMVKLEKNPRQISIAEGLAESREHVDAGRWVEARDLLLTQLQQHPPAAEVQEARELLGVVNVALFLSDAAVFGKTAYIVEPGDSLAGIAQEFDLSPDSIIRGNGLDSTVIHPGDCLMLPDGKFHVTMDLPKGKVRVYHDGSFFKQYSIQRTKLPRFSRSRLFAKVTASTYWRDGNRVTAMPSTWEEVTPWMHLTRPGYMLYGIQSKISAIDKTIGVTSENIAREHPTEATISRNYPPQGVALFKDDLLEMQLLLRRGTPVTIIRERENADNAVIANNT